MKHLLLVRHAKSSWDSPTLKDHDRPLNERGNKEAPMMAQRLLDQKILIDSFVTSTAQRAFTTAEYFHKAYRSHLAQLVLKPELYQAHIPTFYEVISGLDDGFKTVALFSHNPGITDTVNSFGVARVDEMPTCGVFGVSADIKHWKDFETAEKRFWLFDYPKKVV